jgi:hypothetical protein
MTHGTSFCVGHGASFNRTHCTAPWPVRQTIAVSLVSLTAQQASGPGNVVGDFGGREGIRTLDLSVANAALSQLSYAPTVGT